MGCVRELTHTTEVASGRPLAFEPAVFVEDLDEEYKDEREFVSIDQVNQMIERNWSEKRERDTRNKDEKKRVNAEKKAKAQAEAAKKKRLAEVCSYFIS